MGAAWAGGKLLGLKPLRTIIQRKLLVVRPMDHGNLSTAQKKENRTTSQNHEALQWDLGRA